MLNRRDLKKFKVYPYWCLSRLFLFISLYQLAMTSPAQFEQARNYYRNLEKQTKEGPVTIQFLQAGEIEDFDQVVQIVLLRHGEPALNKKGWRKRREAIQFVKAYDSVGVYEPQFIPIQLTEKEVDFIYTSTLPRSISTAEQLFDRTEDQVSDPLFREFERKIFKFPNIKLPLKWWLTGSRMFWFMGFNKKGIESAAAAKSRAREAVIVLEQDATTNGKTLLVSHGLLNHYLAKYLRKNGWTQLFDGGKGYMSQKLFVRME